MMHELNYHDKSLFLTLTYNDEKLPPGGTLCKRHVQLFLKSIRQAIWPRTLRYYIAGEYGSKSERPHYHGILFGVGLDEEDRRTVIRHWQYCDWEVKSIRENSFGVVNHDTVRYVAQYIDKKLYGDEAIKKFDERGLERPFNLQSKGLGLLWAKENRETIEEFRLTYKGRKCTVPRYYLKKLEISEERKKKESEEAEIKEVEKLIGLSYTDDELYRVMPSNEYIKYERERREKAVQACRNRECKDKLKERELNTPIKA